MRKGIEAKEHGSLLLPRTSPVTDGSRLTVARLIEVAAVLLDEVGVDGFNTNLLAERAEMGIRSVYRYFPNKFAVIAAVARSIADDWTEWLEPHFLRLEDNRIADWRAVLRSLLKAWIEMLSRRAGGIAVAKALAEAPELRSVDAEIFAQTCDRLAKALVKRGIKLSPARVRAISQLFTACTNAVTDLYLRLPNDKEREELWRELIDMHITNLERYLHD